jgi:hypothetical protein
MASPESIINQAAAYLSDIKNEALQAADKLESLASLPYQIWIGFPSTETVELTKASPVTGSEDLPELSKVEMDLSMVGNFDPNKFKQATYVSPFFAFLEPKLEDFIENGGPGISDAVQQALFDNMRERDLQLVADALDLVRANYGKTGFPLPTSMLRAQENEVIKKYQDDRSNRNREVTALIAERAQDTMKAAVSSGIRMEAVQSQFSLGFARLFMDVSSQLIQQYRLMQDAEIAEFEGQIKAILAKTQIAEINSRLEYAYQEQLLKQWEIETSAAIEKTKANIQQAAQATEVKLRAATGLSEFYKSMVAGIAGQANAIAVQTEDISQ